MASQASSDDDDIDRQPDGGGTQSSSISTTTRAENRLRRQVNATLRSLQQRDPLPYTYKHLLQSSALTRQPATMSKHKFYRRVPSQLRTRVEGYEREIEGKDPFDRISQRKPIDQTQLAVALTMRAFKEHEQKPLLKASLAATAMHPERKKSLDGMALYLQQGFMKKAPQNPQSPGSSAQDKGQLDILKRVEQAKLRKEAEEKKRREDAMEEERVHRQREEERQKEEEQADAEKLRQSSYSERLMYNLINQGLEALRKMDYSKLYPELAHDPRPFELIIDEETCKQMGLSDYFTKVTNAMNFQWIEKKVKKMRYTWFDDFYADVELIAQNAMAYHSNPDSAYHKAGKELKRTLEVLKQRMNAKFEEAKRKKGKSEN